MPHGEGQIWCTKTVEQVLKLLKTPRKGLTKQEARARLKKGKNLLPRKEEHFVVARIFLRQWVSPLIYLLLLAAVVSFFMGELLDAAVIFATALVNAIVGFIQEYKANKAFKRLRDMVQNEAWVIRAGETMQVDAQEIVVGDILVLHPGDRIVADARLLEAHNFNTDESTLTGESQPVSKRSTPIRKKTSPAEQYNMVWSGTTVARGTAHAVVVATGGSTYFASIVQLAAEAEDRKTPLQKKLDSLARWILLVILSAGVVIVVVGMAQSRPFGELFVIAVAAAIAAIPEGLVVSLTIVLTVGMQRILARSALTRRLIAAETLGSVTVVCTDKTGTLTEGVMRAEVFASSKERLSREELKAGGLDVTILTLMRTAALCNDASVSKDGTTVGDSTEVALLEAAISAGFDMRKLQQELPRVDVVPFEAQARFMATLNGDKKRTVYVKGAPEVVMRMCTFSKKEKVQYEKQLSALTKRGLRVLGFATGSAITWGEKPKGLSFVGLIGLRDPLREGTKQTVEQAAQAGVRTIMITGDHAKTALSVARELGIEIDGGVVTGEELETRSMMQLKTTLRHTSVFARIEPKHKIKIVRALQSMGEVTAMTGDGVNDAPALRQADVGVAVGSGTDVTKETADLVLLDNNFKTIIAAISEGRVMYENIRKVITYLLSDAWSEVVLVLGSLAMGLPLPVFAVQILWVNFIEDVLPNIALSFERGEPGLMNEPPRRSNDPLIDRPMRILIFGVGASMSLLLFLLFWAFYRATGDLQYARTVAFMGLGSNSLLIVFSIRSLRTPLLSSSIFENRYLLLAVGFGFLALVAAIYIPTLQTLLHTVAADARAWSAVVVLGVLQVALIELVKYVFIVRTSNK